MVSPKNTDDYGIVRLPPHLSCSHGDGLFIVDGLPLAAGISDFVNYDVAAGVPNDRNGRFAKTFQLSLAGIC